MPKTALRVAIVVVMFGLTVLAGRQAALGALGRANPDLVLRLDSNSADALIARNDRLLLEFKGAALEGAELVKSARRALRAAPLKLGGLRQIGFVASAGDDNARARALMALGNRVSRRDIMLHLWMIEDKVALEDIEGALAHYDKALSITERSAPLFFPVLSAALDDAQIRMAFAPLLERGRPWMPAFLGYVITNSSSPQHIAGLLLARGGMPGDLAYAGLNRQLLKRLVLGDHFDLAERYARQMGEADVLTQVGFNARTLNPALGPLGWELADRAEARARQEGGDRLALTAAPNATGLAATRVLFLQPGTYMFSQTASALPEGEAASWSWILRCLPPSGSETLMKQNFAPVRDQVRYRHRVTVPARCRAQQFGVTVTGADTQGETGVIVGPIAMERLPARHGS